MGRWWRVSIFLFKLMVGVAILTPFCLYAVLSGADIIHSLQLLTVGAPFHILLIATFILFIVRYSAAALLERHWSAYHRYVNEVNYPSLRSRLGNRWKLILYLALAVVAGLAEEWLFRGFLLPYCGLILTTVAFGIVHWFEPTVTERRQWYHVVPTSISGLAYAMAVLFTGSLWPGILVHSVGNAHVVLKQWSVVRSLDRTKAA